MLSRTDIETYLASARRPLDPYLLSIAVHAARRGAFETIADLAAWLRETLVPDACMLLEAIDGRGVADGTPPPADPDDLDIDRMNDEIEQIREKMCACEQSDWVLLTDAARSLDPADLQRRFVGPLAPDAVFARRPFYLHAYLARPLSIHGIRTPAVIFYPVQNYIDCFPLIDRLRDSRGFVSLEIHEHPPSVSPILLRFVALSNADRVRENHQHEHVADTECSSHDDGTR